MPLLRSALFLLCLFVFCPQALAAEALSLVSHTPEGEVDNLLAITVRFSEAMRPLGHMEQDAASSPLRLTSADNAPLSGSFRWLDPETLTFNFDSFPETPLEIKAVVPAGTTALSGAMLPHDVSWNVSTPALQLRLEEPGLLPPEKASFSLSSNYPLDLESLRAAAGLFLDGTWLEMTIKDANEEESGSGRRVEWLYQCEINAPLPKDAVLQLRIKAGVTARKGGSPAMGLEADLPTYQGLALREWQIGSSEKEKPSPEASLRLSFTNEVTHADLLRHIRIEPPANLNNAANEDNAEERHSTFYLSYDLAPGTDYTVTLRPGLTDQYGTTLREDVSFSFSTGDYSPLFHMATGHHALERKFGEAFPLLFRNIDKAVVTLRYLPWTKGAFASFALNPDMKKKAFLQLPDSLERRLELDFSGKRNQNNLHLLNIPAELGFSGPERMRGLVLLSVDIPNAPKNLYWHEAATVTLQWTDLSLHLKQGRDSSLAWLTDLSNGRSIPSANLELFDAKGKSLWKGTSDSQGMARLPGYAAAPAKKSEKTRNKAAYLLASAGKESCLLFLDLPALHRPPFAYHPENLKDRNFSGHLLSQSPLYQPGETVRFTLFARTLDSWSKNAYLPVPEWRAFADSDVHLRILDERGGLVHEQTGKTDAYGALSGELTLSAAASLGNYSFELSSSRLSQKAWGEAFVAAAFRKPDFKVDLKAPASQPAPLSGKSKELSLKAAYFSGAALPGGTVVLEVHSQTTHFAPSLLDGYKTGTEIMPLWGRYPKDHSTRTRHTLNAVLDDKGASSLTLPELAVTPGEPRAVSLEAWVADASQLVSQGDASFLLHPSSYYVGLRTPWFAAESQEFSVPVKAATWDNKTLEGVEARLRGERRLKDGSMKVLWEKDIRIDSALGISVPVSFDEAGHHSVAVVIKDKQGRENLSRNSVFIIGRDNDWQANAPGTELELMADKQRYTPPPAGTKTREATAGYDRTARIVCNSPFAEATALISVERANVRRSFTQNVSGPTPYIDVPLEAGDAPHVFVSVTLIKGRTAQPPAPDAANPDADGEDKGRPELRFGRIRLDIAAPNEKSLHVQVTTDKTTYRPAEEVQATVSVKDESGKGLKTRVVLLAIDERVLRAMGEKTRFVPTEAFPPDDADHVSVWDLHQLLLNMNMLHTKGMMRQRAAMALSLDCATGAGQAPFMPKTSDERSNFSPLVFWLPEGETDASGRLEARFTLPDSMTSYRVVAVAADKKAVFAKGEGVIEVNKPLQILSVLPRFMTLGDTPEAGVLLQNLGKDDGRVSVSVNGLALTGEGTKDKGLALAAGQSRLLRIPLKADPAALLPSSEAGCIGTLPVRVKAVLRGANGEETDEVLLSVKVLPHAPLSTVAAAGVLKKGETHSLPLLIPHPQEGDTPDSRAKLDVILAASPAAGIPLAARQVLDYPWNCFEQRLSRAFIRILRLKHGPLLGLEADPEDRRKVREVLDSAVKFANSSGGFRLWSGMSEYEEASLYLTAYALLVNREARDLGMSMNAEVEKEAMHWLGSELERRCTALLEGEQSDDSTKQEEYASPDAEAMALWLVADQDKQTAIRLFTALKAAVDKNGKANPMAWSWLLRSAHKLTGLPDRQRHISECLRGLENTVNVTPTQMHFAATDTHCLWMTMGSTLRDNGMVLAALSGVRPSYPRLEALANYVAAASGDKQSLSTQEAVFGVYGLAAYLQGLDAGRGVSVKATLDNGQSFSKSFKRLVDPPEVWTLPLAELAAPGGANTGNAEPNKDGSRLHLTAVQGAPHWTARLSYPDTAGERNAGFVISRSWKTPGPWAVGNTVEVEVRLHVPATRRHVLLFDPFPAGLEPLYASRVDLAQREREPQSPWQHEEAREHGMLLYAPLIEPGTYVYTYTLRAAVPGEFVQRASYVEEMYTPEVFGRTEAGRVRVVEQGTR